MKSNKEIATELHREYKISLQKEQEQWKNSQRHLRKWEATGCYDEGLYEKYETAYNEYQEAARETNILARLVIDYEFKEEEKGGTSSETLQQN